MDPDLIDSEAKGCACCRLRLHHADAQRGANRSGDSGRVAGGVLGVSAVGHRKTQNPCS